MDEQLINEMVHAAHAVMENSLVSHSELTKGMKAALSILAPRLDAAEALAATGTGFLVACMPHGEGETKIVNWGYPFNAGQLEDGHRDLKCRKFRPRQLRIQKPEGLMLQSVPP